jgi:hypothetical protein
MNTATRTSDTWASHAVCVAAGARDGLRTAQFFVRLLSGAEGWGRDAAASNPAAPQTPAQRTHFFSPLVSRLAGIADRLMTWTVDRWIALVVPEWRKLPSPFTHGMMNEVARAIRADSFVANPLFNTYFYRAAVHILHRYRVAPFLVLEHRVDAARRTLVSAPAASLESETDFLARALVALTEAAPIARAGEFKSAIPAAQDVDVNLSTFAIACVTLLFAEEGKPSQELDEDQFFAIVGALLGPRYATIADLVGKRDMPGLSRELADIKAMY